MPTDKLSSSHCTVCLKAKEFAFVNGITIASRIPRLEGNAKIGCFSKKKKTLLARKKRDFRLISCRKHVALRKAKLKQSLSLPLSLLSPAKDEIAANSSKCTLKLDKNARRLS